MGTIKQNWNGKLTSRWVCWARMFERVRISKLELNHFYKWDRWKKRHTAGVIRRAHCKTSEHISGESNRQQLQEVRAFHINFFLTSLYLKFNQTSSLNIHFANTFDRAVANNTRATPLRNTTRRNLYCHGTTHSALSLLSRHNTLGSTRLYLLGIPSSPPQALLT